MPTGEVTCGYVVEIWVELGVNKAKMVAESGKYQLLNMGLIVLPEKAT
ncbi:MAG TPA: hypothetical protein VLE70_08780 [Anaerolineae bacterium]|nr:hypothetical protein [Anaerolineae bacterium]